MKNIKKQILDNLDIVDVISEYLPLEKSGQNYKAICPFHDDNDPSLVISPTKQIFKCFVCGTGGNAINFVEKYEKKSYEDVLKKYSKQMGIAYKIREKRKEEYLLEDINDFYQTILSNSKLGEEAKNYLEEKRKLDFETISFFGLGFSPNKKNSLKEYLNLQIEKKQKYGPFEIEEVGIFNTADNDFMNRRLTIPIYNDKNELVGFSGRTLQDDKIKYLNSKESKFFKKNSLLYNLNNVVKLQNHEEILLVEGYFDVISSWKNGVTNVAATMGTALTKEHVSILKKYQIKKIFLGFDKDKAGKDATLKTAPILIQNNIEVLIIDYGSYKDIDEYFTNEKEINWEKLKSSAQDFLLFYIDNYSINNLDEQVKLISELNKLLQFYNNQIKKDLLIDIIQKKLNIDKNLLLKKDSTQIIQKNHHPKINSRQSNINKIKLPQDQEKIIFYMCSIGYENYLYVKEKIALNEFEFVNYMSEFLQLGEMYEKVKILNKIDLLDNIEKYHEIHDYVNQFEGNQYIKMELLEKYINTDNERKKQQTKLFRK